MLLTNKTPALKRDKVKLDHFPFLCIAPFLGAIFFKAFEGNSA
jgi:hypothetical protein